MCALRLMTESCTLSLGLYPIINGSIEKAIMLDKEESYVKPHRAFCLFSVPTISVMTQSIVATIDTRLTVVAFSFLVCLVRSGFSIHGALLAASVLLSSAPREYLLKDTNYYYVVRLDVLAAGVGPLHVLHRECYRRPRNSIVAVRSIIAITSRRLCSKLPLRCCPICSTLVSKVNSHTFLYGASPFHSGWLHKISPRLFSVYNAARTQWRAVLRHHGQPFAVDVDQGSRP